jgi:hypothetical protein
MTTSEPPKQKKFHEFLDALINYSDKSQVQIAEELHYERPNVISMFKTGKTRVPLERIGDFAKVLGVDKAMLLRLAMNEYAPSLLKTIEDCFGLVLTDAECEIVSLMRDCTDSGIVPRMKTSDHKEAVRNLVSVLEKI